MRKEIVQAVAVILVVSVLSTLVALPAVPVVTTASASGSAITLSLLILLAIVLGGVLTFLAVKRYPQLLRIFTTLATSFLIFMAILINGLIFAATSSLPSSILVLLFVGLAAAIAVWSTTSPYSTLRVIIVAWSAGTLFSLLLGYSISLLLVALLTIYDCIAVLTGYLPQLAERVEVEHAGLGIEVGELWLGGGDLIFYSTTAAAMALHYGFSLGLASAISIAGGAALTIFLTRYEEALPGLPIPILCGIVIPLASFAL